MKVVKWLLRAVFFLAGVALLAFFVWLGVQLAEFIGWIK